LRIVLTKDGLTFKAKVSTPFGESVTDITLPWKRIETETFTLQVTKILPLYDDKGDLIGIALETSQSTTEIKKGERVTETPYLYKINFPSGARNVSKHQVDKVVQCLKENDWLSSQEIAKKIGMSINTVRLCLYVLKSQDRLEIRRIGRRKLLYRLKRYNDFLPSSSVRGRDEKAIFIEPAEDLSGLAELRKKQLALEREGY